MKCANIEVKKLSSAFYMSIAYKIDSQLLQEKQSQIDTLCKNYYKKLAKQLLRSDMDAETRDEVELSISQKVGEYRIEQNKKLGVYKLKDSVRELEKLVLVKNNNPLHDNMAPEKITLLRSYYESMLAKYGMDLFRISHDSDKNGQSTFSFWKSKFEQIDGHKYSDITICVKGEDGISAHKVVLPKELKRYGSDSYVFESEKEYKNFLKKYKIFEYHSRDGLDEAGLKKYIDCQFDFDFLHKFVYADKINALEVKAYSRNFLDSIWQTYEYKNNICKIKQKNAEL